MQDNEIEKIASQYYDESLPYHNFDHARAVVKKGEQIVQKCREEDIAVDESVVYYALLFHDAGYHEDHFEKGFDSKEEYSAYLADSVLAKRGFNKELINKVKAAIMSTRSGGNCFSIEDKVVRAADLWGLAADYDVFKENTIRLKKEHEMMTGEQISWGKWKEMAINTVELFLEEEMDITSDYFDGDGNSKFHKDARKNLKTLKSDSSGH